MAFAAPALTALVCTLVLMVALRPLAMRVQLTDKPGGRKNHRGEIPLIGGIAMIAGIYLGLAVAANTVGSTAYVIYAGVLLVFVGAIDDLRKLSSLVRLAAQAAAALIMIVGGQLVITDIGDVFGTGIVYLGPAAVVITVIIAVTVINAFNFIDGLDGLAGCMAIVAVSAGVLVSGRATPGAENAIIVIAAIIGFLAFNFPLKKENLQLTFLGDAGSTLLGLVVVWLTIVITQGESRAISPVLGLWFVLVPVADFFSCFAQRIAVGKSPMSAGREHFHHALLRGGFNDRQVLGILTGLAVFYAGIGLLGASIGAPDYPMFALWLTLGASQYWLIQWIATRTQARPLESSARSMPIEIDSLVNRGVVKHAVQQHTEKDRLNISISTSLGAAIMPTLITRFRATWPQLNLNVEFDDCCLDLKHSGADVAIRVIQRPDYSMLLTKQLGTTPGVLVASPDYLAMHGSPKQPEELRSHRCMELSSPTQRQTIWKFRDGDEFFEVPIECALTSNSELSLILAACMGDGILYSPRLLVGGELAQGRLVPILTEFTDPRQYDIYALYPRRDPPARVNAFIEFLAFELSSLEQVDRWAPYGQPMPVTKVASA